MKKHKRARTKKGHYKGDDKSTPFWNEAWVKGLSPKKAIHKTLFSIDLLYVLFVFLEIEPIS